MSLSSLKASRVRILLALGLVASVLGAASVSWLVAHAQSVGAGQSHSAVLKTGGTIAIWGYNGYGQIGDGTNTQRNVPVELTGTYSAIALGSIHTLALKSDGTVWAWGYNGYGQLGDGTTTGRISPVQVTGLTGVVAISAGDGHSVAVKSDGTVWAWGQNSYGQLGDGTTTSRSVPTQIPGVTGALLVGAGSSHTLIGTATGVLAVGYNGYGQLGDGTNTQRLSPVVVPGVPKAISLGAGATHSVIVATDGTLWAWGYDGNGALGDGTNGTRNTPVHLTTISGVSKISASNHTLALKSDGTVWAWGYNAYGQLGDATTTSRNSPFQVPGITGAVGIAAGAYHSIAMTSSGVVWVWGSNSSGQLGDGTTVSALSPKAISAASFAWKVGTPYFGYAEGTYYSPLSVTVTTATPGATLYYTLDGTTPSTSSPTVASGGTVAVNQSQTLKAFATKAGSPSSDVATAAYVLKVYTPTPSPYPSTYTAAQSVSLSDSAPGVTIRYTLDGSTPTATSPVYSTPFNVSTQTTLKTYATKGGWTDSDVFSGTYFFNYGTLASPTVSPAAGTYTTSVSVTLSCAAGATARYTTDGSTPVVTSTAYSAPIVLSVTTTLNSACFRNDYGTSAVVTRVYTVQAGTPTLSRVSGSYAAGTTVTVTSPSSGATLYYTLDGTDPTTTSATITSGGTLVLGNFTLKVKAVKAGVLDSAIATATYTVTGTLTTVGVAASDSSSYALAPDGTLWVWGYNGYGQLGDGTSTQRTVAVRAAGLTGVTAIAAGLDHAVALRSDGTVWAWGYNGYGQLGDGTTTQRYFPTQVPGLTGVTSIGAGRYHSIALKSDGTVWTWGYNVYGQLGDGTTTTRMSPVQVPAFTGATWVTAGGDHSFALKTGGALWAWGNNGSGELGDGTTTTRPSPVQITALTSVQRVASSDYNTVAVKTDGTLWSWGYGAYGLIGDGTTTSRSTPAQLTALTGVVDVSIRGYHALVAKSDGTVWAWGQNPYGELGDGTTTSRMAPVQATGVTGAVRVAAGINHSLAITSAGVVYAWGYNGYNGLGDGTSTSSPTAKAISGSNFAWKVGAPQFNYPGGTYNSTLTVTVTCATLGATIYYTLDGTTPTTSSPTIASGGTLAINQTQTLKSFATKAGSPSSDMVSAAYVLKVYAPYASPGPSTYTTAQTVTLVGNTPGATIRYTLDGSTPTATSPVYSTPLNISTQTTLKTYATKAGWTDSDIYSGTYTFTFGTLAAPTVSPAAGTYTTSVSVTMSCAAGATPRYTTDGSNPVDTSAAYAAPVAITQTSTVKAACFQTNFQPSSVTSVLYTLKAGTPTLSRASGSYAAGTTVTVTSPSPGATLYYTLDGTDPTMTSATIASGGTLVLGNFTLKVKAVKTGTLDSAIATATYTVTGTLTTVGVAASDSSSYALAPDGTLWVWGYNAYGQLGDGTNTQRSVPVRVAGLTGVKTVVPGLDHAVALRSDGTVWAWGYNGYGQVGDGTTTQRYFPTQVPGLTGVTSIGAGRYHSVALKSDGTVWAWGYNQYGQLGDGTTTQRLSPTQVPGFTGATWVAAGGDHSFALKTGGALWAWGNNGSGELGDGTTTTRLSPVLIAAITSVQRVASGNYNTLAIKTDGTLWSWGYGAYGLIGDGTTTSRSTPVQITTLTGVVDVSTGGNHSLAAKSDGTVWAWGQNPYGELGDGTTTSRPSPVQVTGVTGAVRVAAGLNHSLAITSAGIIYAWGFNTYNALGDGTSNNSSTAKAISGSGFTFNVAPPQFSYAAGTYNTTLSVAVTCATAGATIYYTLDGTTPTTSSPTIASGGTVAINQTQTLKAFAAKAGSPSSNVVSAAYVLKAYTPSASPGPSTYTTAQAVSLSDSTPGTTIRYTLDGSTPTVTSPVYSTPLNIATQTTVKAYAIKAGWADSDVFSGTYSFTFGTLAAPTISPAGGAYTSSVSVTMSCAPGATPRYTTDGSTPTTTSTAYASAVAITQTATVKAACFQTNYATSAITSVAYTIQVGAPTLSKASGSYAAGTTVTVTSPTSGATLYYTLDRSDPTTASATIASGGTLVLGNYTLKVKAVKAGATDSAIVTATYTVTGTLTTPKVAAGDSSSYTVTSDGRVWAWGSNGWGQLGDGTLTPQLFPKLVAGITGAVDVAAGTNHVLVLTSDGSVWAWGANGNGQLGDGTTTQRLLAVKVLSGVSKIAAGDTHSVALKTDGTVWAWGANSNGQLDDGTTTQRLTPTKVTALTGATAIGAGGAHSFAVLSNQTLWGWGNNGSGELGDGTTTQRTTPAQVVGLTGVTSVTSNSFNSYARTVNGVLWGWGSGSSGLNGDGTTSSRSLPIIVSGLQNVTAFSARGLHVLTAESDGSAWAWGSNSYGELGDGTSAPRFVAGQVVGVTGVVSIAAGTYHSVAVTANGIVYVWGYGGSGQLGDGTNNVTGPTPKSISTQNQAWKVAAPMFSVAAGTWTTTQSVTVTCPTAGATIRYTLDGTTPTTSSPTVASGGTVSITQSRTLKAFATKTGSPSSDVTTAVYVLKVPTPTATPSSGTFTASQSVTLADSSSGTTIRYTLDGSTPTATSPAYSTALGISTQTTLKAYATKAGWTDSDVFTGFYNFNLGTLAAPTPAPAAGTYIGTVSVTLACPAGSTARYTTNGTNPLVSSPAYTAPIVLDVTTTLKSACFNPDYAQSPVVTTLYTVQVAAPTFSRAGGTYALGTDIVMTEPTPGATVYYTLDGTTPTTSSNRFSLSQSFTILSRDYTLKAKGVKAGCLDSAVTTATYVSSVATMIAAGDTSSYALRSDGTVWAWGDNTFGQLGDGTTVARAAPIQVAGLGRAVGIAAGFGHVLALKDDGTVWAWGMNGHGQLGDGTTTGRLVPTLVPGLRGIVSIAAGKEHSVAVDFAGNPYAWGLNETLQLGISFAPPFRTTLPYSMSNDISYPPGYRPFRVAAGGGDTFLIHRTAATWGWGDDSAGQLGTGDADTVIQGRPVFGLGLVKAISSGPANTVAIDASGNLWSAGQGGSNGDGTNVYRSTPVMLSSLGVVTSASSRNDRSVAAKADGTVWAWGKYSHPELGDSLVDVRLSPVQVPGITGAVQVAAGRNHFLAVTSAGVVFTWGENVYGQLGTGNINASPIAPVAISGSSLLFKVGLPLVSVSPGTYATPQTVTITTATAGAGLYYTTDGTDPTTASTPVPADGKVAVSVAQLLKVRGFKTGYAPSDVLSANYVLKVAAPTATPSPFAGLVPSGQTVTLTDITPGTTIRYTLDGSTPTASSPVYSAPFTITTRTTVKAYGTKPGWVDSDVLNGTFLTATGNNSSKIAAGESFTLLLKPDGTVWAWGANDVGQTGLGNGNVPVLTPAANGLSGITRIAAGQSHGLALKTDGTVLAWGSNDSGQLGDGTYSSHQAPAPVLSGAAPLATVKSICAGRSFSVALLANGNLMGWGTNTHSQLVYGATPSYSSPTGLVSGVSAMACGQEFVLAVVGGQVRAWGANDAGQLGNGHTAASDGSFQPVPGLSGIVGVAAGNRHSFAWDDAGRVYAWGDNSFGQLADGTFVSKLTPNLVPALAGGSIFAANDHTLFVAPNGTAQAAGLNANGQLGDGTTANSAISKTVPGLSSVVALAAGPRQSFAISATGVVYAWGDNSHDQLGTGTKVASPSPSPLSAANFSWVLPPPTLLGSFDFPFNANTPISVSPTCAVSPGTLYYTLDGSQPTTSSPSVACGGFVQVDKSLTLKVFEVAAGRTSAAAVSRYVITANAPTATPPPGIYLSAQDVTLDNKVFNNTWGTVIRYTTNGSDPTATSTQYTVPIHLAGNTLLKARAFHAGWTDSALFSGQYTITAGTLPPPIATPAAGTYVSSVAVTLLAASGAEIRYTTNGSTPTATSTLYTGPITLTTTTTIKAIARLSGMTSAASSTSYTIKVAPPDSSVRTLEILPPVTTTLYEATPGAEIHYTVDGSDPTLASPMVLNGGTIWLDTFTLKLKGFKTGCSPSDTVTFVYSSPYSLTQNAELYAGAAFSVMRTEGGSLFLWGANDRGQLGDGTAADNPVPTRHLSSVNVVAPGARFVATVASDNTVWAWGDNSHGQLGTLAVDFSTTRRQVPGLSTIVSVAAGRDHVLALGSNGKVWAWGDNSHGQLGNGTIVDSATPLAVPGLPSFVVKVMAAGHRSFAIDSSGHLYAWGSNAHGELGDGTLIERHAPQLVPGWSGQIDQFSGSDDVTAFLRADGTIWTFGSSSNGQLGTGASADRLTPAMVLFPSCSTFPPAALLFGSCSGQQRNVWAVALGAEHALATIPMNGDILWGVFGWGKNSHGQRATAEPATTPTWVDGVPVSGDGLRKPDILTIAAGDYHSIGLTSSGALWGWGDNTRGQLGDGTTVSHGPQASTDTDLGGLVPPPVLAEVARSDHTAPATVTASNPLPGVTIRYALALAPSSSSTVFPSSGLVLNGPGCVFAQAFKTGMTPSAVKRLCVDFWAPPPLASPGAGFFSAGVDVTLTTVAGTTISYRLDGLDPNQYPSGALTYTAPIHLTTGTQLRARAIKSGWRPSDLLSADYLFNYGTLTAPVFTPTPGTYVGAVDVSIAGPAGATIRYTTDGTAPSATSAIYSVPLHLTLSTTILAGSFRSDYQTSGSASAGYSIQLPPPVIALPSGVYGSGTTTAVSHPTAGTEIHYTTDGSDPTVASPIVVSGGTIPLGSFQLKVKAFKTGNVSSAIVAATYLLPGTVVQPTFTPPGGTYQATLTVSAATATPGAVIRYTTNGTAPTTSSPVFPSAGLSVTQGITLKATAFLASVGSGTTTASYNFMPSGMPSVSPTGGAYSGPLTIFLSAAPAGFVTRYTLDGTDPTATSAQYVTPLQVTTSAQLRAAWFRPGWTPSVVLNVDYILVPTIGNRGYAQLPPPIIDGAPLDAVAKLWWGDTVRLNTRYVDTVSPAANVLHNGAQAIPATKLVEKTEGPVLLGHEAQFDLPDGALGNQPLTLTASGRSSGPSSAVLRVGPPITFSGITTAASARSTAVRTELPDHVYIADSEGIWDIGLYQRDVTKDRLIGGNVIIGSKVTTANTFLYVTTDAGRPSIMEFNVATGSTSVYRDLSTLNRDLQIACMAVDFDGNVAYVADRKSGSIIQVPRTGTIKDKIGSQAPYTFPTPCQMDGQAGTVVFPSGTSAYQVLTGTGESSVVYTGEEEVHSVLVRSAGAAGGYVFSVVPWVGWIASVNTATGLLDWVYSPDPDDPSYILLGDRQFQRFHVMDPQRVLVNNDAVDGETIPYPSAVQLYPRVSEIRVDGLRNQPISLRLVDPPDIAAYIAHPGKDDNAAPFGAQVGLASSPTSGSWSRCLAVTADASGVATVYLQTSSAGGDNYRLEASFGTFDPTCDDPSAAFVWNVSPLYTVWKRIFVEHDFMFQKGGFLWADAPAGASEILVAKLYPIRSDGLSVGDRIAIFDVDHPYDGAHDTACISSITDRSVDQFVTFALDDCSGAVKTLAFDYSASASIFGPGGLDLSGGGSAAVGRLPHDPAAPFSFDEYFYGADLSNIQTPYDEAFIEFVAPPSGSTAVPCIPYQWFNLWLTDTSHIDPNVLLNLIWFSTKWFKHYIPGTIFPGYPDVPSPHNYIHLIGATRLPPTVQPPKDGSGTPTYGYNFGLSANLYDWSYVFVQGIMESVFPQPTWTPYAWMKFASEHELGHQWELNGCGTNGDHDTWTTWCDPAGCGRGPGPQLLSSLMKYPLDNPGFYTYDRFTYSELLGGDAACGLTPRAKQHTLRLAPDPL